MVWVILLLVVTVAIALFGFARFGGPGNAQLASLLIGFVAALWLFVLCLLYQDAENRSLVVNLMIVLFGSLLGLVIGALISPWPEDKGFSDLTKAFGALATGYIGAKADDLVKALLAPDFALDQDRGFRIMSFLIALVASSVATYAARVYLQNVETPRADATPNKPLQPTRAAEPNGQRESSGSGPRG